MSRKTVTPSTNDSAPKRKPAPKPNPKFIGKTCELCGCRYEQHQKTGKYPRFITHHLKYPTPEDPREVTAVICLSCHNWMSGNGACYSHPLKPHNPTPEERAMGPFWFAVAVVDLYDSLLILPAVLKAAQVQQEVTAMGVKPKDTVH